MQAAVALCPVQDRGQDATGGGKSAPGDERCEEEGWYGGSAPPDAAAEEARLGKEADDAFANERDWVLLLSSWC